jgi:predicted small metal-binding protein
MKTMTCAQLGGPCEEQISGSTPEELLAHAMTHLETTHPEMAADVKGMSQEDPKMVEWNNKFKTDWENTPETV